MTRGMVNADAFKAAKKNQVFINLGRGPVIDEEALVESLASGQGSTWRILVMVSFNLPHPWPIGAISTSDLESLI